MPRFCTFAPLTYWKKDSAEEITKFDEKIKERTSKKIVILKNVLQHGEFDIDFIIMYL